MRGLTTSLWPVRYKPFPDEVLSSWLVRLAHGHGLKVQTFCNLIFGNRLQIWNRDIDRLAPEWLLNELSEKTGTDIAVARGTTVRSYEGRLFARFKPSGSLPWILVLKLYHRTFEGFGFQFCPHCLSEDMQPYFRRSWRVALSTTCDRHKRLLLDRCPECGSGVAFHRRDMGKGADGIGELLSDCHYCGFDLRIAPADVVPRYNEAATTWLQSLRAELVSGADQDTVLEKLAVMRQLTRLLTSTLARVVLHSHVCEAVGIDEPLLTKGEKIPFESRSLLERHHLIQLVAWLMADLEPRLRSAWSARALRYNHMKKDFDDAPDWYISIVDKFANWRER